MDRVVVGTAVSWWVGSTPVKLGLIYDARLSGWSYATQVADVYGRRSNASRILALNLQLSVF